MTGNRLTKDNPCVVGDVIQDAYANPAVVVSLNPNGSARTVIQTCGSDRGRLASPGMFFHRYTHPAVVEGARDIARTEWRKRGYTRDTR